MINKKEILEGLQRISEEIEIENSRRSFTCNAIAFGFGPVNDGIYVEREYIKWLDTGDGDGGPQINVDKVAASGDIKEVTGHRLLMLAWFYELVRSGEAFNGN